MNSCSAAQRTLRFTISSLSHSTCLRSEWPSSTISTPASRSIRGEISPVNAPSAAQPMFCAPSFTSDRGTHLRADSRAVKDGITKSSSASRLMPPVRRQSSRR